MPTGPPGIAERLASPTGCSGMLRSSTALRLFTVYAPPEHPAGTVHQTRSDADAAEEQP